MIEDHTDEYGLLVWEREDPSVDIAAHRRIHKFKAAIDERTRGTEKTPYKPKAGEYFVPRVESLREDESIQTFREWVERSVAEESD